VTIKVLYVPGCPNHQPALDRLNAALAAEGVRADIEEVAVPDAALAESLRFPGSPTVRVNGVDIFPQSAPPGEFSLSCRWYEGGFPSVEAFRRALLEARSRESRT
jgi:hypothetical protein